MTAEEFKEAQARLGLTNEQTAALLRVSIRTVEKWRQGLRGEIPGPVVVVFVLLEHYRGACTHLKKYSGRVKMKITRENTQQADGYTDEDIRECPRCWGAGQYMGSKTGGVAEELKCDLCEGFGIVTLTEKNEPKTRPTNLA